MNRRGFLKLFGLAAPVAAVAPTYFFAPVGGWKSDIIANPLTYVDVQAITLNDMLAAMAYDNFFVKTTYQEHLRSVGAIDPFSKNILMREPFKIVTRKGFRTPKFKAKIYYKGNILS